MVQLTVIIVEIFNYDFRLNVFWWYLYVSIIIWIVLWLINRCSRFFSMYPLHFRSEILLQSKKCLWRIKILKFTFFSENKWWARLATSLLAGSGWCGVVAGSGVKLPLILKKTTKRRDVAAPFLGPRHVFEKGTFLGIRRLVDYAGIGSPLGPRLQWWWWLGRDLVHDHLIRRFSPITSRPLLPWPPHV